MAPKAPKRGTEQQQGPASSSDPLTEDDGAGVEPRVHQQQQQQQQPERQQQQQQPQQQHQHQQQPTLSAQNVHERHGRRQLRDEPEDDDDVGDGEHNNATSQQAQRNGGNEHDDEDGGSRPTTPDNGDSIDGDDMPDDIDAVLDDLFGADDFVQLHPRVAKALQNASAKPHEQKLSDQQRKAILRHFPPVRDISLRAPQVDASFATTAHPATVKRDKQLAQLQGLAFQALRPLLAAWSAMCDGPAQRDDNFVLRALQAATALSLHAIARATDVRRTWILTDVDSAVARAVLRPVSTPLFGESLLERMQAHQEETTAIRRMQQQGRPNGQRQGRNERGNSSNNSNNQRNDGRSFNRSRGRFNSSNNSGNRYNNNRYSSVSSNNAGTASNSNSRFNTSNNSRTPGSATSAGSAGNHA